MKITKNQKENQLFIGVEGRLDTSSAPELESVIAESVTGIAELVIDLDKLDYLSSAGLRVLLKAQKIMNVQGKMVLMNVNESIMEVFEITGFTDILTII